MKAELVSRNYILLSESPIRSELGGMRLYFNPSEHWLEQHPHEEPIAKCDLLAGKDEYDLPELVEKKDVQKVEILIGDEWVSIFPLLTTKH